MDKIRLEHELAESIDKWGWKSGKHDIFARWTRNYREKIRRLIKLKHYA